MHQEEAKDRQPTLALTTSIRHLPVENFHAHSAERLTRTSACLVLPVCLWFLLDDSLRRVRFETRAI